ncbi:MAG TPA: hypothetical protein VF855_09400 [Acidimicrobiales bacterium]
MRMRNVWTISRGGLALGLVALALAACGGGDDSTADTTAPKATTSAASPDTTAPGAADTTSGGTPDTTSAGGGGEGDLLVSDVDPCVLLTRDEIEPIVGHPVGEPQPDPFTCSWEADDVNDASVAVNLFTASTPDAARECADQRAISKNPVDVDDLGSSAWWEFVAVGAPYNMGNRWVCVDDGYLSVGLTGGGDDAAYRPQAEELTKIVLGRL